MSASRALPGVQGQLRGEVETRSTLTTLYSQLLKIVQSLSVQRSAELRSHPQTAAFKSQLGDILPKVQVPYFELAFRRSLCHIVDDCEGEEEVYHLCFAIIQHIGSEVEMYVEAVNVDPDQIRYRTAALELEASNHRERPHLVSIDGGAPGDEPASSAGQRRRGRRSPG